MAALSCPSCGGTLEANATVYFDVELDAETRAVTQAEPSLLNDTFDGTPFSVDTFIVSCEDCGHEVDDWKPGVLIERLVDSRTRHL